MGDWKSVVGIGGRMTNEMYTGGLAEKSGALRVLNGPLLHPSTNRP